MKASLSYGEVKWALANLLTLRANDWPDPECYAIELTAKRRAKFVNGPCEAAGGVERRLSLCGIDGFLVKQVYAWGESFGYLSINLKMDRQAISKGIKTSLKYITGKWPKDGSYSQFKGHKKGEGNMRDRNSEPTKKKMPVARVISINDGPNRAERRHSPPPLKRGESYKKNYPYHKKGG